jgi:hypothetical protein
MLESSSLQKLKIYFVDIWWHETVLESIAINPCSYIYRPDRF